MDHLGTAANHEERRLLDHVVADVDDQVGRLHRAMHEVAGGQRCVAEEARVTLVDHALAHLGGDEGNAGLVDQLLEDLGGHLAVGPGADHQDRAARGAQLLHRGADRLVFRQRPAAQARRDGQAVGLLGGDVLRQLQVHRAGLLFLGQAERLADPRGNVVGGGQLVGVLGQRLHHADHVEDLEAALLGLLDRLLPGDHQHRHAAQVGVGAGGDQVGGARAEGRQADPGLAGEAPVGGGHEAGRLFVAGEHQPDLRLAQGPSRSRFSSPGIPKTYCTPSFSRHCTTTSAALAICVLPRVVAVLTARTLRPSRLAVQPLPAGGRLWRRLRRQANGAPAISAAEPDHPIISTANNSFADFMVRAEPGW